MADSCNYSSSSSSSSSSDQEESGLEIAAAGAFTNACGRAVVDLLSKKREFDIVDGTTKLINPKKGTKEKRISVEDLNSGDHIYVGAYMFINLGKLDRKKEKKTRKHCGHLWKHHFLIGRVQNLDDAEMFERKFDVYELTAVDKGSINVVKAIANADTRKLTVVAKKSKCKEAEWEFNQADFEKYYTRGMNRYNHDDYETDAASIDLVIRRAESACQTEFKGKYDMLRFNCEHFVTSCKGLGFPYGYSYQFKTFGTESFPEPLPPGSVAVECDIAETATLAGDIQATDDDKDYDDKISIIDLDYAL